LAAVAPLPTLLFTPVLDRDATFADVNATVTAARAHWPAQSGASTLDQRAPAKGVNEFLSNQIVDVANWLAKTSSKHAS
jgi:hypothetical protein